MKKYMVQFHFDMPSGKIIVSTVRPDLLGNVSIDQYHVASEKWMQENFGNLCLDGMSLNDKYAIDLWGRDENH